MLTDIIQIVGENLKKIILAITGITGMAKYFREEEFKCPCCGRVAISPILLLKLDKARGLFGSPVHINSGYRCESHNKKVGGKFDSTHLAGGAADLRCNNSRDRFNLLYALLDAGFRRVGIASTFIHVDVDETKAREVLWVYKE